MSSAYEEAIQVGLVAGAIALVLCSLVEWGQTYNDIKLKTEAGLVQKVVVVETRQFSGIGRTTEVIWTKPDQNAVVTVQVSPSELEVVEAKRP